MMNRIQSVAENYQIAKPFREAKPFGNGHINETFKVSFGDGAGDGVIFIFQHINTNVFKNPAFLMDNIMRVLQHSAGKLASSPDAERRCIHMLETKDGSFFCRDASGEYWRAYHFIDGARTFDILETPEQAFQAARAFGNFQHLISDLPGGRLHETIPNFHNTPSRLRDFDAALKADVKGRAKFAREEIDFVQAHRDMAPVLLELQARGGLPERITHNDTKLNNVLLDNSTGEGICVIDLDTVMPGLSLYDFGDMVRTSVSPAAEDETDLSKVQARTDVFKALVKGYIEGAKGCLVKKEIELMPFSGKLITFEIGLRFLTDFLSGDAYFRIHRENHNLDRCRTQFTLVKRLEEKEDALDKIIGEFI